MQSWFYIRVIFVLVSFLSFSSLILSNNYKPLLYGIPYTLWTGFIISLLMLIIVIIGSFILPSEINTNKEE